MPVQAQDLPSQAKPREVAPSDDPDAAESATTQVPLDEIRRYVSVYNAVRQAYVDPVDDDKLMHSAIKGLLLDLDPHSTYFDKDDAQAFDEETSGAYAGIGVEVQPQPDGTVKVIAPIDDTPAARAGIKSGDIIIAVDGKPLTPADAEGQGPLRGKPGSQLVLTHRARRRRQALRRDPAARDHPRRQRARHGCSNPVTAMSASPRSRPTPPPISNASSTACRRRRRGKLRGPGAGPAQQSRRPADVGGADRRRPARQRQDRQHPRPHRDQRRAIQRDAGRSHAWRAGRGAGRCRFRQRRRSARRRAHRQPSRAHRRQPHLRQGLGADPAAAGQRRLGQAHHRALLHAQRQVDPGARDHAGRGAASGQGRRRPGRLRRSAVARAPAWRGGRRSRQQRRRRARRRCADRGGAGGTEKAGRAGG